MTSVGMFAVIGGLITPPPASEASEAPATAPVEIVSRPPLVTRSVSYSPQSFSFPSPREYLQRFLFGYRSKTKRSLAEEAESGDEISVCSWIKDGSDPNEPDAYGYTPLLNACALGRLAAVVELIKNGADVNRAGPFGFTPLHAAAQNGHREVAAELLKAGADINMQNDDRDTPMHLALRALHIEIVNLLWRLGGNSKIPGFENKDCVQCATALGLADLANALHFVNNVSQVAGAARNFSSPNLGLSH